MVMPSSTGALYIVLLNSDLPAVLSYTIKHHPEMLLLFPGWLDTALRTREIVERIAGPPLRPIFVNQRHV